MKHVTVSTGAAPNGQAVSAVAIDGGDGTLLGALPKLDSKATAAQTREAYNALVDALVKAGLAYEEVK